MTRTERRSNVILRPHHPEFYLWSPTGSSGKASSLGKIIERIPKGSKILGWCGQAHDFVTAVIESRRVKPGQGMPREPAGQGSTTCDMMHKP